MNYNPFPQLNLPYGKDNKYFLDLFDSIIKVNRKFIEYKVKYDESHHGYEKHLERVFAYELYRHWGNKILSESPFLILNAEISKVISVNKILCDLDDNQGSTNQEVTTVYPDMVLHHSQGDDKAQVLICEIKRDKNLTGSLIFGDLYKISCYMTKEKFHTEYEPFRYGVFIIAGDKDLSACFNCLKDTDSIETNDGREKLSFRKFVDDKVFQPSFDRIVCVSYDGNRLDYNILSALVKDR